MFNTVIHPKPNGIGVLFSKGMKKILTLMILLVGVAYGEPSKEFQKWGSLNLVYIPQFSSENIPVYDVDNMLQLSPIDNWAVCSAYLINKSQLCSIELNKLFGVNAVNGFSNQSSTYAGIMYRIETQLLAEIVYATQYNVNSNFTDFQSEHAVFSTFKLSF